MPNAPQPKKVPVLFDKRPTSGRGSKFIKPESGYRNTMPNISTETGDRHPAFTVSFPEGRAKEQVGSTIVPPSASPAQNFTNALGPDPRPSAPINYIASSKSQPK